MFSENRTLTIDIVYHTSVQRSLISSQLGHIKCWTIIGLIRLTYIIMSETNLIGNIFLWKILCRKHMLMNYYHNIIIIIP